MHGNVPIHYKDEVNQLCSGTLGPDGTHGTQSARTLGRTEIKWSQVSRPTYILTSRGSLNHLVLTMIETFPCKTIT